MFKKQTNKQKHTHTHIKPNQKQNKKKKRCFNHFSTFPSTFPTADFPIHYRVAYKWRIDRIIYQQVND